MSRKSSLEDRFARLSELLVEPEAGIARRELAKSLGDRSQHLVAKAAKLTAELGFDELTTELAEAFDRFMVDPVRTDKGCIAKNAIVKALVDLDAREEDVYLRGVRHRQPEPSYGKPVDTAVPLRASSAEGLMISVHPDLVLELTELLIDPEMPARIAAARVLAASGRVEAEPLLRLKAHLGDEEPEVTSEALVGLLALAPRRSLSFVGRFLSSDEDSVVEAAALALGESRLEEAVPLLSRRYQRGAGRRLEQTLLIAISMLRREPGLEYLLSLIQGDNQGRAVQALVALAIHRGDDTVCERTAAAVEGRRGSSLRSVFEREFRRRL